MNKTFTKLFTLCIISLFFSSFLFGQKNIEFQSSLFFNGGLSDIWGYVDEDGREYALVGKQQGFAIVDVTAPTEPELLYEIDGDQSTWRDIKTWEDYAYVVDDEAGEGLIIVDMTDAPNDFSHTFWYGWPEGNKDWRSHNIYIDENGFAYLTGASSRTDGAEGTVIYNYGTLILDLKEDPLNPTVVGVYDPYVHDAFVRGDTAWFCQINDGLLVVADVSDKADIKILGSTPTSSNFTHQVWLSDDNQYAYTLDEVSNGYIDSYSVGDVSDMQRLDIVQSSPGEGVIPHNTFFLDEYLITAYYRDGVTIHDVSNPSSMVEVGNYDTSPNMSGDGFNGCWGVYPYLPSGNIIAADIENGLYVLKPTYVRSAQLEVNIVYQDGNAIPNIPVILEGQDVETTSNLFGEASLGICEEGTYNVLINGGAQQIQDVELIVGETTEVEITINVANLEITILDFEGNPVPQPIANFTNDLLSYSKVGDNNGNINLNGVVEGQYDLYIAAWGYETIVVDPFQASASNNEKQYYLKKEYRDDFVIDLGWTVEGTAPIGQWEIADPIGTYTNIIFAPELDVEGDLGTTCYVTENGSEGSFAGASDVDDGFTVLTSPSIDVSSYEDPYLSYYSWFQVGGGGQGAGPSNDYLTVRLLGASQEATIEVTNVDTPTNGTWVFHNFRLKDFIDINESFNVEVYTTDDDPGHLVEAAFDAFSIVDSSAAATSVYDLSGIIQNDQGESVLAEILITAPNMEAMTITSNDFGGFLVEDLEEGAYNLTIASWGYLPQQIDNVLLTEGFNDLAISLEPGYEDNFELDLGWSVDNSAVGENSAIWELGAPVGTTFQGDPYNPNDDVSTDIGFNCYATGLAKGEDVNANDVDGGPLVLTSPPMDLSTYEEPWITYHRWFANGGTSSVTSDEMTVSLSNGTETVLVETLTDQDPTGWAANLIQVRELLEPTNNMTLIFSVADNGDDHITEGAVDLVAAYDSSLVVEGIRDVNELNALLAPNPVEASALLLLEDFQANQSHQLTLTDLSGKIVLEQKITEAQTQLNLKDLSSGLYLLSVKREGELVYVQKFVKE